MCLYKSRSTLFWVRSHENIEIFQNISIGGISSVRVKGLMVGGITVSHIERVVGSIGKDHGFTGIGSCIICSVAKVCAWIT